MLKKFVGGAESIYNKNFISGIIIFKNCFHGGIAEFLTVSTAVLQCGLRSKGLPLIMSTNLRKFLTSPLSTTVKLLETPLSKF